MTPSSLFDRIPPSYIREDGILLAKSSWWEQGCFEGDFYRLEDKTDGEIACYLREGVCPPEWILLRFSRFPRAEKSSLVLPLPEPKTFLLSDEEKSFPDHLRYIHERIHSDQWRKVYEERAPPKPSFLLRDEGKSPLPKDLVLFTVLKRLSDPFILNASSDIRFNPKSDEASEEASSPNRLFVDNQEFVLFEPYRRYSLHSLLNFSPSVITQPKLLYILYQIIAQVSEIHDKGLFTGNMCLSDIFIDETLMVNLHPDIHSNLIPAPCPLTPSSTTPHLPESLNIALNDWMSGRLSNFEYLMILNNLSGRNTHNPNYYPILPWVRDFSSPTGGWRDLSKSKFRLNKGDQQLDLTYSSLLQCNEAVGNVGEAPSKKSLSAPHHVSDLLSEITYYVYKARVTKKEVLCKYVRSRWVPHEYPSSIGRLMEWTPDECIPDFYSDPHLFSSIHEDLGDLELPPWTSNPTEFIQWHRESLESHYVSERLHQWIDLTFGYKLTGSAAVRAKSVCLHLADEHTDLRDNGVMQLFNSPHPARGSRKTYFSYSPPPIESLPLRSSSNLSNGGSESIDENISTKKITLPSEYDPLAALSEVESNFAFLTKSYATALNNDTLSYLENSHPSKTNNPSNRDLTNLGALILELFVYKKFSCLGARPSLESRLALAKYLLKHEAFSIPMSVRDTAGSLLSTDSEDISSLSGSPSAKMLLNPFISSLPFLPHFQVFAETSRNISIIDEFIRQNPSSLTALQIEDLHQIKVREVASNIVPLLDQLKKDELSIFLPTISKLFKDQETAVTCSWYLFDPLGKSLGPSQSLKIFLEPLLSIFESSSHTSKHLKLYHRTFLLSLIIRLGTGNFLRHFISYVIQAVGGYKDYQGLHQDFNKRDHHQDEEEEEEEDVLEDDKEAVNCGEMFTLEQVKNSGSEEEEEDSSLDGIEDASLINVSQEEDESICLQVPSNYDIKDLLQDAGEEANDVPSSSEGNISQVAGESVVWLAHRLGPVLSARYLTRNLLKMLNLCFSGPESSERLPSNDRKSRVSNFKTRGDANAENVLDTLGSIGDLYGEQMILLQYLPYARDLIGNCKKRLNANMEGGLLGVMALVHYILPFLSDSVIMAELQESLLSRVLFPVLNLFSSKAISFPGGSEGRQLLAFRILDVIYLIGLRIGEEMSRAHLTPLVSGFFSSFDNHEASEQLRCALSPELAYTGYVAFYHLMGEVHLRSAIPNVEHIVTFCASAMNAPLVLKPINFTHLRMPPEDPIESPTSLGNKLSAYVSGGEVDSSLNDFLRSMISRESPNTSRHLRGNWLAYWEHEQGRTSESHFSLKQIRLQSFTGHASAVKSLYTLDNENSFLSGSRDKTVKVWSLRSQHDDPVVPQWTYSLHKKSVTSVLYLEMQALVASCDSSIHIWDPFVGASLHQFSGLTNVNSLVHHQPSTALLASTLDSVHLVDVRSKAITDLKVCIGSAGQVKCMCIQSDGHTATIGHSSGYISNLDLRTGKIRHTRKGHEGEILVLGALGSGSKFVSTSLDQSVNLWDKDAKLIGSLSGHQEPVHCVVSSGGGGIGGDLEDIITGTTGNRIGVRQGASPDAPFSCNKLRSDVIRGGLTSLRLLSMNSLLLLGTDAGSIQLIC